MTEWGIGTRILKVHDDPIMVSQLYHLWYHLWCLTWSSALFNSHRLHVFLCTREKRAQQKNV